VKGAWRNFRIQRRVYRAYPNPAGPSGDRKESETPFTRLPRVGVAYGSTTRLILMYLQTEVVRTNSPEVERSRSMKSWMGRMSLTTCSET
jgi:hypothetical protein